jgi:hypothetical protein
MRKQVVILGVLFMAAGATAQLSPIIVFPDTSNTNKLTACEEKQGFFRLMDGTRASLAVNFVNAGTAGTALSTTWRDTLFSDSVNGPGTRAVYKTGDAATDIRGRLLYADFDVRISYRNTDNSGFFYRGKTASNPPWQTAIEVGIDNTHTRVAREQTGGVFDIFPPTYPQQQTTWLYSSGRWNELRIIAIGDSIQHWINGIRVADYRMFSDEYFTGRGTVAGVTTGYNTSKWGSGQTMSFQTAGSRAAGPILRGIIGVQGAHPGNMYIRNFRIDTIPTWVENNAFYPDTVSSCVAASVRGSARSASFLQVRHSAGRLAVFIPGESLREASLVDAFGRLQVQAAIRGQTAEFGKSPGNGVYFLRFRDAHGTHSARISLVGLR